MEREEGKREGALLAGASKGYGACKRYDRPPEMASTTVINVAKDTTVCAHADTHAGKQARRHAGTQSGTQAGT